MIGNAMIKKFNFPSRWDPLFIGLLIYVIGAFYLVAAIVILLIAKVGFTIFGALGPLAIAMLLFPQTRQYFESWFKIIVGYAVIPLIFSALLSFLIFMITDLFGNLHALQLSDIIGFILSFLAATFFTFQIPQLASSLSATTVAAVGAGVAVAIGKMATGTITGDLSRAKAGVIAAGGAAMAGGSSGQIAYSAFNAMRQSAHARQIRSDERRGSRMFSSLLSGSENLPPYLRDDDEMRALHDKMQQLQLWESHNVKTG